MATIVTNQGDYMKIAMHKANQFEGYVSQALQYKDYAFKSEDQRLKETLELMEERRAIEAS